jgi:hypothetical protein
LKDGKTTPSENPTSFTALNVILLQSLFFTKLINPGANGAQHDWLVNDKGRLLELAMFLSESGPRRECTYFAQLLEGPSVPVP